MSAPLLIAQASQIVVCKDPSIVKFRVAKGCVICGFHPLTKIGGGIAIANDHTNPVPVIQNLIKALSGRARVQPNELNFKLVGDASQIESIRLALQNLEVKI